MKKTSGFTLIELLITISIVAVLTGVGVLTYTNFLKESRDAKRVADLKAIQSALEQYMVDRGFYPSIAGMNAVLSDGGPFNSTTGAPQTTISTKTYFNNTPQDILHPDYQYCYQSFKRDNSACDNTSSTKSDWCLSYALFAKFENKPGGTLSCGVNSDYNYQLFPQ